ncbi:hypothetical protein GCM10025773_06330 [Microbacterium jejuense]
MTAQKVSPDGEGPISRVAKFADAADLGSKTHAFEELVRAWICAKDSPAQ